MMPISEEDLRAYAEQRDEEKRARAAMPGGEVREFCTWLRRQAKEQTAEAEQIKFGNPWQVAARRHAL